MIDEEKAEVPKVEGAPNDDEPNALVEAMGLIAAGEAPEKKEVVEEEGEVDPKGEVTDPPRPNPANIDAALGTELEGGDPEGVRAIETSPANFPTGEEPDRRTMPSYAPIPSSVFQRSQLASTPSLV